jgi:serine/threonine protein phosphatase PrpC
MARTTFAEPCEDSGFLSPEHAAAGIFDGMGGHAAGEIASMLANEAAKKVIEDLPKKIDLKKAKEAVRKALTMAHNSVLEKNRDRGTTEQMGTTGVLALIARERDKEIAVIGWVGDSRAHLLRDGKIEILTLDDAKWLKDVPEHARARQQEIQATITSVEELPDDTTEYKLVRSPIITQYLGAEDRVVEVHMVTKEIQAEDVLLLASDGLTDVLTLPKIAKTINGSNPEDAAQLLYNETMLANIEEGPRAKDDDVTIQVLKFSKK